MTDITVSRELLRQLQSLCMDVRKHSNLRMATLAIPLYDALRAALDATCQDSRQVQTAAEWVRCAAHGAQHDVREIIADMQTAPVQEQQFTADELDLMRQWFESMQDTNRSFVIDADKKLHQKIIAAIQAAPRAEQPRKAVKLSDSEILTALDVEYVSSAQNRELFLSDARTIEQAVWAKLGVRE